MHTFHVEGTTYAPTGLITDAKGTPVHSKTLRSAAITRVAEICALCNDATIVYNSVSPAVFVWP